MCRSKAVATGSACLKLLLQRRFNSLLKAQYFKVGHSLIVFLYVWQGEKGEPNTAAQGIKGEPGSPGLPGLVGPKVRRNTMARKEN